MNRRNKIFNKYLLISVAIGIASFFVLYSTTNGYIRTVKQREEIETIRRFSKFSTEASNTVIKKQLLLNGYLAFLETTDLQQGQSVKYLEQLIGKNDDLIRSITSIEDTTIKWIYPLESNQSAVGVDLSTIEGQKDIVLKIKNERVQMIQGPVDLVQGGRGIIIRMPVIKNNGEYYGQLSIVLDLEKLSTKLESLATFNELKVNIISNQNGKAILENPDVLEERPMTFNINDSGLDWSVYVVPLEKWNDLSRTRIIFILSAVWIAILSGWIFYYLLSANYKLKHIANHDPLTGLYNRRFLEEYQTIIFSSSDRFHTSVGFMLLDLNGFKKINDQYGHKIGDEVLLHTARILTEQTRRNESIFRLGGDEFLVLFPDLKQLSDMDVVKNRILKEFKKTLDIPDHTIVITPSIGVANYPDDGMDFDQILHVADKKMYEEKVSRN